MGIMVGGSWGVELERKEGRQKRMCSGGWGERKLIKWSEWNWREIFYIIDIMIIKGMFEFVGIRKGWQFETLV